MYCEGVNPIKAFINNPEFARYYFINSAIRMLYSKVFNDSLKLKHYAGKKVLTLEEGNDTIKKHIEGSTPFFYGRFGQSEIVMITAVLLKEMGLRGYREQDFSKCMNNGLFPQTEEIITKYRDVLLNSASEADIMGTFRGLMEDYYLKKYCSDALAFSRGCATDFWLFDEPFTYALKDKKVLVVHPLASTIEEQYQKRDVLFTNPRILPSFELKTMKAVQTIAGTKDPRFSNWFEALEWMDSEIVKIDFDIAILGCGAYGMPLCANIKKRGKKAIYMGGVTQMLFGIRGARWDADERASKLYNKHWVSPPIDTVPQNKQVVEDGCYW